MLSSEKSLDRLLQQPLFIPESKRIDDLLEEFKERRDLTLKELETIDGLNCVKPNGAFYMFISYDFNKRADFPA